MTTWLQQQDPTKLRGSARGGLAIANQKAGRTVGVSIFDLGDWTWRDAFDAGEAPGTALREALEADDTFGILVGGE